MTSGLEQQQKTELATNSSATMRHTHRAGSTLTYVRRSTSPGQTNNRLNMVWPFSVPEKLPWQTTLPKYSNICNWGCLDFRGANLRKNVVNIVSWYPSKLEAYKVQAQVQKLRYKTHSGSHQSQHCPQLNTFCTSIRTTTGYLSYIHDSSKAKTPHIQSRKKKTFSVPST